MRAVLLGGGLALLISLLGTRLAITQFTRLGYGQEIRDDGLDATHAEPPSDSIRTAAHLLPCHWIIRLRSAPPLCVHALYETGSRNRFQNSTGTTVAAEPEPRMARANAGATPD